MQARITQLCQDSMTMLARLAEERGDTAGAQSAWKRAALLG